jgi:hypothetical protein
VGNEGSANEQEKRGGKIGEKMDGKKGARIGRENDK